MGERAGGASWGLCGAHPALPVFGLLPLLPRLLGGHVCLSVCLSGGGGLHSSVVCGACGSLTCFSAERLPEGISAPAASPVVRFP